MVDQAARGKWGDDPAFLAYLAHTPTLIPWCPRTRDGASLLPTDDSDPAQGAAEGQEPV